MSEQIERLCKLLEDVDSNTPTNPKNIKLSIFRLEQKIDELAKRLEDELPLFLGVSETEPKKGAEAEADKKSQTLGKQGEGIGVRGIIARQENVINNIGIRIGILETSVEKIEPNNIRALIKDIAEIVMREEKKTVEAEMDNLKGNQKNNGQVVNMLKEQLKIMDEKFEKDIENKIEKKELFEAKNQLRRRVIN